MSVQKIAGAHARRNEQDRHEPGIDQIHKNVIVLDAQVRDPAEPSQYAFRVVHIKHVVNHHDHHSNPPDIIHVVSSHIIPTFAIIYNIILIARPGLFHQPKLTFSRVLC